ncbi:hypothetical protein JRI60_43485 [Archangium violaceum]|uniref:hypothetical protein n=1 Tax=Archangium violaceum TaxID=83451 RepID=UPI001951A6E3|nr:hypothetical protein [Archangium violaceum]QRN95839.1 hypothetical protein JRI60_43485 [Archangium violaceum]
MSATLTSGAAVPAKALESGQSGIRRLFAVEAQPRIVELSRTTLGRLLIILGFGTLLSLQYSWRYWLPVMLGAAACAYVAEHRMKLVALSTFAVLALGPLWFNSLDAVGGLAKNAGIEHPKAVLFLGYGATLAVFGLATALLALHRRFIDSKLAHWPVLLLLGIFSLLVAAATATTGRVEGIALWALAMTLGAYFWFICYALRDQGSRKPVSVVEHLGLFRPFWGSTSVSFGKGAAYLARFEARTAEELAVTQLKGLKLLLWARVLLYAREAWSTLVHQELGIPWFAEAIAWLTGGRSFSPWTGWASLVLSSVDLALGMAIFSHTIIGSARIAGFRLPRNMWRPLEARSLAEFWNRYYFYFKELLADFFFYPTFLRCFKRHPRLRMFFATFMAAGVGNALFHFMREIDEVIKHGWYGAVAGYQSYLFYCLVLALGVGISQSRQRKSRPGGSFVRHWVLPCTGVWLFFLVLYVFGHEDRTLSLSERFRFLFFICGGAT